MGTVYKVIKSKPNDEYLAEKAQEMVDHGRRGAAIFVPITDVESGPELDRIFAEIAANAINLVKLREQAGLPVPRLTILISLEYDPRPDGVALGGMPA